MSSFGEVVFFREWERVGEEISIENALENIFSFKPADMVEQLNLLRPIYRKTTHYGHFTNPELPWEQLDETRLASLKQLLH